MNRDDQLALLRADLVRANSLTIELMRAGVRVLGIVFNPYPVIECDPHPALARLLPDTPCFAWGHGPRGRWSRYCGIRDGIHVRWTATGAPPPPSPERRPTRRAARLRAVS